MERDEQFEIQYLLSLIIAVLGTMTADGISRYIDMWVGYGLLILIFLYIVVFNLSYTLESATGFNIAAVEWLSDRSRWLLAVVTAAFLFFVVHMLGLVLFQGFTQCQSTVEMLGKPLLKVSCGLGKIFISYGAPVLIVGATAIGAGVKMVPPITLFRNISFYVVPSSVRIFPSFDDGQPLLIRVVNDSEDTESFNIDFKLPKDVTARHNLQEEFEDFTEEAEIDPDEQKKIHLELRYDGRERRRDVLGVKLIHERGTQEKDIDVLLES